MDRHHPKHAPLASLLALALAAALLTLASPTAVATPSTPTRTRVATVFGDTLTGGYEFTCGLRTDGTAICWGNNEHGQSDPPEGTFTSIDAGYRHACGLRTDGTAECWGQNVDGSITPLEGSFTHLAAGNAITCGLRNDGRAECWGDESHGDTLTPPEETFSSLDVGWGHGCGPVPDQTIVCWGWNEFDQATPPSGTFTAVATGADSTCGLRTDGTVACWGDVEPYEEPPDGTYVALEGNFFNTCALRTDSTAICWGSFQTPPPPDAFIDLGVEADQACGLHGDGTVACWGRSNEATMPPPDTVFAKPGDPVPPTCDAFDAFGPFPDVPPDHAFCTDIEWAAAAGITTGYDDGTYRPDGKVTRQAMAAFLYRADGEPAFTPPETPTFDDVPTTHPFYAEIEWAAAAGIADGYPNGTYRPAGNVTRQAMAAFLHRAEGEPPFTPPEDPTFTDVPKTHPFFAEIEWAAAAGIADGYPDGTYRPTTTVTRQATAAFLLRAS